MMIKKREDLVAYGFALVITILCNPVFGQWTQVGMDIDGEAGGDRSGRTVSLSKDGNVIAIGAMLNADNGFNTGHVRVYRNENDTWVQVGNDIDGKVVDESSGSAVSLNADGSIVAIGAKRNNTSAYMAGCARVYQNVNNTWTQIGADIYGEDASDEFGEAIALSDDGSVLAVGASGNDGNGSASGHVRVYQNNNGTWTQIGDDIDGSASSRSGFAVSMNSDGTRIAIGAYNAGEVRIYENTNGTWTQVGAAVQEGLSGDYFGVTVALNDDGSVFAAGGTGVGGGTGEARVYKYDAGTWVQVGNTLSGDAPMDYYGTNISISDDGSIIAVGAHGNDINGSSSGLARVYQNVNNTWTEVGSGFYGEGAGDKLGFAVNLSGDGSVAAFGAHFNYGVNGPASGHARVYKNAQLTGVKSKKHIQNNVKVFPNPSRGVITVTSNNPQDKLVRLTDVSGKTILSLPYNTPIDIKHLPSGIYLLNANSITKKLIVLE